ncbi:hypothetical protein [Marinomonas fungiae]|uniref:hypothetical protein n=1 Tax=Marinomonas fungiae TaxID=1137284 RepID=UPI003A937203
MGSLSSESRARLLTVEEKQNLRRDMAESSAWARAELKRRYEEKAKQNSENVSSNATTTESSPKTL